MFFYYHFRSCLINITLLLYSTVPAYCGPEEYERVLKLISLLVIYISFSPSHIISIELLYFFFEKYNINPDRYTYMVYKRLLLLSIARGSNRKPSWKLRYRLETHHNIMFIAWLFFFFLPYYNLVFINYYLCGRLMNGRRLKVDTGTCLLFACISYMLARIQYYNIMCIFL